MSRDLLSVEPAEAIRDVAQRMVERNLGAVLVLAGGRLLGIMTERDVLYAIGSGCDPDIEPCRDHITWDAVYAHAEWSLEEAAMVMVRGGFRHLVVIEDGDVVGLISVRDLMRAWSLRRVEAAAKA